MTAVKPTTREPSSWSQGARASAKIATSASVTRIRVGSRGKPPVRKAASRQATVRPAARLASALPVIADPRVDHGVEHVHEEVDDHDHRAAEEHRRLDDRKVAGRDPLVEEAADAGPGEERLDHDGALDHQH